jgi:hypothetical protein
MLRLFYRDSLWSLIGGPTIWAGHFLLCYISAAIFCAKVEPAGFGFLDLRIVIGVVTLLAFIGIAFVGFQAVDHWRRAMNAEWATDSDSLVVRRLFIGRVAFLLAGLSAIGVLYTGLVAIFIDNCR